MSQTVVDGVQVRNPGKRTGPMDTRQKDRRCFLLFLITGIPVHSSLLALLCMTDDPNVLLMIGVRFICLPLRQHWHF